MTEAMRDRALASAASAGLTNVEVHLADATALPVADASVDVVISNGVLNLVPEKDKAFAEIWRVLRPAGRKDSLRCPRQRGKSPSLRPHGDAFVLHTRRAHASESE